MIGIKGTRLPTTGDEQPKVNSTTDDTGLTIAEGSQKPLVLLQTLIDLLTQEPDITISTLTGCGGESIEIGDGDILELDAPDILVPKTGCVIGMVYVIEWIDLLQGDQDTSTEVSSMAS